MPNSPPASESAAAALRTLLSDQSLSSADAASLFADIMRGAVDPAVLAAILALLARRGETADEIAGAARAMRDASAKVDCPDPAAIDIVGTGGDGKPTFNISSASALVAAAAGATVAKHGNRSNLRPSGSADGLRTLGINVDADVPTLERCLAECRVAFLFAVTLHPAMKHAIGVRKALGVRTIFNLLGPLTNPASVRRLVLGVNRIDLLETMRAVLAQLGFERAVVVHGADGLCDVSISGPTHVAFWGGAGKEAATWTPDDLGVETHPLERLFVSSAAESAAVIESVCDGVASPALESVVANAGVGLWIAGRAEDPASGVKQAREAIAGGAGRALLDRWRQVSFGA